MNQINKIEGKYGPLQVLQSAAGFYVGCLFTHSEHSDFAGLVEPGERISGYFATKAEAQKELDYHNRCLSEDDWDELLENHHKAQQS